MSPAIAPRSFALQPRHRRGASAVVLAVVLLGGCGQARNADAARCADRWNADVPEDLSDRFEQAIVHRWTDKAEDDGCSVVFVSESGERWVLFAGVVRDGDVASWDRVAGERWGADSPEGGPTEPNVAVLSGGLVSVPD